MEKIQVIYEFPLKEQRDIVDYLKREGFKVDEAIVDSQTPKTQRDGFFVAPNYGCGGNPIKWIHVQAGSRLEKVLDEFEGRDSKPSVLPRSSNSGA
jgi:hypothetical protein